MLQQVNTQGGVVASLRPSTWDPAAAGPRSLGNVLNGSLTWAASARQFLYVPENPYVFASYDPANGLVDSVKRNDPSFQSANGAHGAPGDRVMRAVSLPGGDLLVQVVKRSVVFSDRAHSNVIHSSSYLELFDSSFNLKATGIPVEGFGYLQGAASDGSLYFNQISR